MLGNLRFECINFVNNSSEFQLESDINIENKFKTCADYTLYTSLYIQIVEGKVLIFVAFGSVEIENLINKTQKWFQYSHSLIKLKVTLIHKSF